MKRYTIGAMFTSDLQYVLLIEKQKPAWQKGRFNFPGGSIEEYETPEQCVAREFEEEVGLKTQPGHWDLIGQIVNAYSYEVDFFTTIFHGNTNDVKQLTAERPEWHHVNALPGNVISNLHWLIPFALNTHKQGNVDALKFGTFNYSDL